MKIPPALLMASSVLFADTLFLMPHQWHDARHRIAEMFRRTPGHLTIVTDTLQDTVLRRALQKRIETGAAVTLMTSSNKTAAHWAIYRNLDACVLTTLRPLGYSLCVTDKAESCLFTNPLSTEEFRSSGMMHCADSAEYAPIIEQLKKECRPYFTPDP